MDGVEDAEDVLDEEADVGDMDLGGPQSPSYEATSPATAVRDGDMGDDIMYVRPDAATVTSKICPNRVYNIGASDVHPKSGGFGGEDAIAAGICQNRVYNIVANNVHPKSGGFEKLKQKEVGRRRAMVERSQVVEGSQELKPRH